MSLGSNGSWGSLNSMELRTIENATILFKTKSLDMNPIGPSRWLNNLGRKLAHLARVSSHPWVLLWGRAHHTRARLEHICLRPLYATSTPSHTISYTSSRAYLRAHAEHTPKARQRQDNVKSYIKWPHLLSWVCPPVSLDTARIEECWIYQCSFFPTSQKFVSGFVFHIYSRLPIFLHPSLT